MQEDQSRKFLWLALKVSGGVTLLLLVLFGGLIAYVAKEKRKWDKLTDTHDLKQRAVEMGQGYLVNHSNAALVIGITQKGQRAVLGLGRPSATNAAPPDAHTLFEIGSVTKLFTAIALARMELNGQVMTTNTVRELLPEKVPVASALESVALVHLATHTSGLPRLPGNLDASDASLANPYAKYRAEELYQFLAIAKPNNPPGKLTDYSNVGFALLGHLLSLRAGQSYEALVRAVLLQPLGMTNTVLQPDDGQRQRLAPGHAPKGELVPAWDFDAFAPAGGFRSSANDLLTFIEANLSDAETPVGQALAQARKARRVGESGEFPLGWQREVLLHGGMEVFWHNGGTGGYVSFIGLSRKQQIGVVVLANYGDAMAGRFDVDKIGMDLLKLGGKVSLE